MTRDQIEYLFLNVGHFYNHLFLPVFATVAAFSLATEWSLSYAELIPYSVPGFLAFGLGSIPAGWIADKWSRSGMMVIFFLGIGSASSLSAFAWTPLQIRYVVTFTVSATAIPSIAWLYHEWGFTALFLVLSVLAACIFLAVVTLPCTER